MEELSHESRRWLEDILPFGRTINPSTYQDEHGLTTLRQFSDESKSLNEICLEGVEQLGREYDKLNDDLKSKLDFVFGPTIVNSVFDESHMPELEWLVSISMMCEAETTDDDLLKSSLCCLEEEIAGKQKMLVRMKNSVDQFRNIESEFAEEKKNLERALQKIEISNEAAKAKMAENVNSLNNLTRKRRQYKKASAKVEQDLLRRNIQPTVNSSVLFEQQSRIDRLIERADSLEAALRYYCGLSSDKQEAQRQLNEVVEELHNMDMKLLEKIRKQ